MAKKRLSPSARHELSGYKRRRWSRAVEKPLNKALTPPVAGQPVRTVVKVKEVFVTGPEGPQGGQGDEGPIGKQGAQGVIGVRGATGAQGPQGDQGPAGAQGVQGPTGPQGEPGFAGRPACVCMGAPITHETDCPCIGPAGPAGAVGATGARGAQGAEGKRGEAGRDGKDADKLVKDLDKRTAQSLAEIQRSIVRNRADGGGGSTITREEFDALAAEVATLTGR